MIEPNFEPLSSAGPPKPAGTVLYARPLPATPTGCLRVVSYNVLAGSPQQHPTPFARLLTALAPDVLLLQEWDHMDALELQEWFDTHLPGRGRWWARRSAGRGVAIVSRHPLQRLGPYRVELKPKPGEPVLPSNYFGPIVGFVAAVCTSPWGDLALGSVHLTCCGGPGTVEDQRRVAEARAVNRTLKHLAVHRLIVGGDLNLVGTPEPLDELRARLDRNAADLLPAEPRLLGGEDPCTWRDERSEYPPGRLDWLVYSSQTLRLSQQFLVDTTRMSDAALQASGLSRTDTAYSDHLPLVLDVAPQ